MTTFTPKIISFLALADSFHWAKSWSRPHINSISVQFVIISNDDLHWTCLTLTTKTIHKLWAINAAISVWWKAFGLTHFNDTQYLVRVYDSGLVIIWYVIDPVDKTIFASVSCPQNCVLGADRDSMSCLSAWQMIGNTRESSWVFGLKDSHFNLYVPLYSKPRG